MALVKPPRAVLGRGRAGEVLPIELAWAAAAGIERPYAVQLTWLDERGLVRHETWHPIGYRLFPPSRWPEGRLVKEWLYLLVPRRLPAGRYHLVAGVADELAGRLVPLAGAADDGEAFRVVLGTVLVVGAMWGSRCCGSSWGA
jgi:hypothetical protein